MALCNLDFSVKSDNDDIDDEYVNLSISKEQAKALYDKAGEVVEEDIEEITIAKHQHLLKDSVALIIDEVLREHPLPFQLQQFQLVTLHCIGSLNNVVLISPTGRSLLKINTLIKQV